MDEQSSLDLKRAASTDRDLYLCHNGADKPWVEMLASRIENEPYRGRYLSVVYDKWDFEKAGNIVLDIEKYLDAARFVGVVVSKAMLAAEWPTLERTIAVWSDPSGTRGRVIPLLRGNVTLPASLRVRNWIDFRSDENFEQSFGELVHYLRGERMPRGRASFIPKVSAANPPYEPAPFVITSSVEADCISERLLSNLYRVTSIPDRVFHCATTLREKKDINESCEHAPPFILRDGKIFTFSDLKTSEEFRPSLSDSKRIASDQFSDWFSDDEYRRRAIELLNVCLKDHAWKQHLRFDRTRGRYFFSPVDNTKPVRIAWRINGKRHWREVTTGHTRRVKKGGGSFELQSFGWRQQCIKANFMYVFDNLMLKLEPTYLLTKDDGKTARTSRWVGPILSRWINQERNGQVLRSLRFWSLVLAGRGAKELSIETGQTPIKIDLTPISGALEFGIANDQMDFDRLMEAELQDDQKVPQLEMFGQESVIGYAEEIEFSEEDREDEGSPEG